MVGLQSGMRKDRFDRFGEALRVIREGRGHLEAVVFSLLQKLPGILAMLRRRFMGHQDKPCHDLLYISGAFRRLYPGGTDGHLSWWMRPQNLGAGRR